MDESKPFSDTPQLGEVERAKLKAAADLKARDIKVEEYKKWLVARQTSNTTSQTLPEVAPSIEHSSTKPAPIRFSTPKVLRPTMDQKTASAGPDLPEMVRDDKGELVNKEFADE